jgi:hypothetical protein
VRAEFRPGREWEPTPIGLCLPDEPILFEQWTRLGRKLGMLHEASVWSLGDWLNYGYRHYVRSHGRRFDGAVELTGLAYQTLKNYASTARRIPLERRRPKLSYSHHFAVVSLPPEAQEDFLDRAEREGWSFHELQRQTRAHRQSQRSPLAEVDVDEQPTPPDPTPLRAGQEQAPLRTTPEQREEPVAQFVTLDVELARRTRWEGAAGERGLSLEDWLIEVADEAAAAVPSVALA